MSAPETVRSSGPTETTTAPPAHPVYVISKGRADRALTAKFMETNGMPFHLVIEPTEEDAYREAGWGDHLLVLPFHDLGQGSVPARNWCWEHARETGASHHWIVDDNIWNMNYASGGRRIPANPNLAFRVAEEFESRYVNIGMTGFNYQMFGVGKFPPFRVNCHIYSCLLIRNDLPFRWRGRYNEDTDLCLQVLSGGLCTVQINAFQAHKVRTMVMAGGNTDELYDGDGRLKMARSLERQWPGIVTVTRKFGRPQHHVNWRLFQQPLRRREDLDWTAIEGREWKVEARPRPGYEDLRERNEALKTRGRTEGNPQP